MLGERQKYEKSIMNIKSIAFYIRAINYVVEGKGDYKNHGYESRQQLN
jgi:hypothetical protein